MRIFFDTSVLLAACIEEHVHHERALAVLTPAQEKRHEGFTSGHAVLEMYSAMTRMPRSPRMLAAQALMLIQENILKHITLVVLTAKEYAELLQKISVDGTVGGQTYDALHISCAEKCNAERIYTLNARHFQHVAKETLRSKIVAP